MLKLQVSNQVMGFIDVVTLPIGRDMNPGAEAASATTQCLVC
jgi:hypothetical protein